jgi:hypothetical protein
LLDDFRTTMTDKIIDWNVSETNSLNLLVDAGLTAAMTTGQVDLSAHA